MDHTTTPRSASAGATTITRAIERYTFARELVTTARLLRDLRADRACRSICEKLEERARILRRILKLDEVAQQIGNE